MYLWGKRGLENLCEAGWREKDVFYRKSIDPLFRWLHWQGHLLPPLKLLPGQLNESLQRLL